MKWYEAIRAVPEGKPIRIRRRLWDQNTYICPSPDNLWRWGDGRCANDAYLTGDDWEPYVEPDPPRLSLDLKGGEWIRTKAFPSVRFQVIIIDERCTSPEHRRIHIATGWKPNQEIDRDWERCEP